MKKWICLLAALALSASLMIEKEALICRAVEDPTAQTTATEPTQPEETCQPLEIDPNLGEDTF